MVDGTAVSVLINSSISLLSSTEPVKVVERAKKFGTVEGTGVDQGPAGVCVVAHGCNARGRRGKRGRVVGAPVGKWCVLVSTTRRDRAACSTAGQGVQDGVLVA